MPQFSLLSFWLCSGLLLSSWPTLSAGSVTGGPSRWVVKLWFRRKLARTARTWLMAPLLSGHHCCLLCFPHSQSHSVQGKKRCCTAPPVARWHFRSVCVCSCSPRGPSGTCCPSSPSCWPGLKRGCSTSKFCLRRPTKKTVSDATVKTAAHTWKEDVDSCWLLILSGYRTLMDAVQRPPLLHTGPVSEGQFYSPPESLAGLLTQTCKNLGNSQTWYLTVACFPPASFYLKCLTGVYLLFKLVAPTTSSVTQCHQIKIEWTRYRCS